MSYVKIVVYAPLSAADAVRKAAGEAGAGKLGNYDFCSTSIRQTGRFRPLKGAKPTLGKIGKIVKVQEERIEFLCDKKIYKKVVAAIKKAHPYEEPALEVYPLVYP